MITTSPVENTDVVRAEQKEEFRQEWKVVIGWGLFASILIVSTVTVISWAVVYVLPAVSNHQAVAAPFAERRGVPERRPARRRRRWRHHHLAEQAVRVRPRVVSLGPSYRIVFDDTFWLCQCGNNNHQCAGRCQDQGIMPIPAGATSWCAGVAHGTVYVAFLLDDSFVSVYAHNPRHHISDLKTKTNGWMCVCATQTAGGTSDAPASNAQIACLGIHLFVVRRQRCYVLNIRKYAQSWALVRSQEPIDPPNMDYIGHITTHAYHITLSAEAVAGKDTKRTTVYKFVRDNTDGPQRINGCGQYVAH